MNNGNSIKAFLFYISNLHVFPEADSDIIPEDYTQLAKIITTQVIVEAGNFRHKKYKTNFLLVKQYLDKIFILTKKIHLLY